MNTYANQLAALAAMSNQYGANPEYVLAGGGNTSFKSKDFLWIKGSGTSLATIKPEDFVVMERSLLNKMWFADYPADEAEREAAVLQDMMDARIKGENRRPSVETLLHDLFPQQYILHVHPAMVNGLTCAKEGKAAMQKLFPEALWVDACKPGYILALECKQAMDAYKASSGKDCNLLFLQNHGIFFAADTVQKLDVLASKVMDTLAAAISRKPNMDDQAYNVEQVAEISPVLRALYGENQPATVKFVANNEILAYDPNTKSLSPDHIVYAKAKQLFIPAGTDSDGIRDLFLAFTAENGYKPRIVFVEGLGMFSCGNTMKEALTAQAVMLDAIKVVAYTESFGGVSAMPDFLIDFIVNWEVESYRSKVSLAAGGAKRLANKVAVVTGGAQGFGKGIADVLYAEGAYIAIVDMNLEGAKKAAAEYGASGFAVYANVSDEESVKAMVEQIVAHFGGIDLFVSNAGIVKAGDLNEMTKQAFELVTAVNYTGFFLCTKYATKPMKLQNKYAPGYMMDIVEINSKSGLEGSNKNFAYAGSKFGSLGLVQSFAMELAPYNIKVNGICPGNFLDGPLWSDPERGLFIQYLNAGKVPGAKTVADVRRFYESKVPMNRGCLPIDVARAVMYCVEQKYETGQAVPVTGGQVMLN
ncbi:MAG: SDR family NAD(P)-dependent oxidoreductase [Ruminococcaceae bacterium]|nr:SDR family NAD(P)-dependent oxidoreductase [Oscillospiraceae bacterium]